MLYNNVEFILILMFIGIKCFGKKKSNFQYYLMKILSDDL